MGWLWAIVEQLIPGALSMLAKLVGKSLKPLLEKGLNNLTVDVVDMSFTHIQMDTPFITLKVKFSNLSIFVIEIVKMIEGKAKLKNTLNSAYIDAIVPFQSSLNKLSLKPRAVNEDDCTIFILPDVAKRIVGHVSVGQVEHWIFDCKWQVKVNGEEFELIRTIEHKQAPQILGQL